MRKRTDEPRKRTRWDAWGEWSEPAGRPADLWPATCMRVRTRTCACVHFHHRARRNCKVAYMQGVKLRGRSRLIRETRAVGPPRERYRSVATANFCAPRVAAPAGRLGPASPMSIVRERLRTPACTLARDRNECLSINEVWRGILSLIDIFFISDFGQKSRARGKTLCVPICTKIPPKLLPGAVSRKKNFIFRLG